MSEATDFVTAMHDNLGEHYQLLMMKHKGDISADTALHVAALLTAAQNHAAYTTMLQEEIATLRKALIAIEKARQSS
jgi:hypothetical protein